MKLNNFLFDGLKREIKELYLSTLILEFAISAINIYEPVYLYTIGFSLKQIVLFFIGVYFLYFFIVPAGANVARKMGYEHSIFYGTIFSIFYYLSLFNIPKNVYFIYSAIVMLAVSKCLYWPAFHADFARFGVKRRRGKEITNLNILFSIIYILGPLFGGFIISIFGFKVLFIILTVIILLSNIPMLSTKEVFTPIPFSYKDAYKRLLRKEYRKGVLAYLGYGTEFVFLIVWPIFIYLVAGNFFSIGLILAISTLVNCLALFFIGRITDEEDKYKILKGGIIFNSLSWFSRIFVSTPLGVFFLHLFTQISQNLITIPLVSLVYNQGSETSVMKTIVFFEMSLVMGKLIAMFVIYLFLLVYPRSFAPAFILSGVMVFFYGFIAHLKEINEKIK